MRDRFKWYLSPSKEEMDGIWAEGFLTVDANVLLDLYRYHEQTRERLLKALEAWTDRVWLSEQASEEFFRNRRTVITSAEKTFKEATSSVEEISKAALGGISKLRGHRLVPRHVVDKFDDDVQKVISEATSEIEKAKNKHPDYLDKDQILDRILTLFDGCVGSPLDEKQRRALFEEGEKRRLEKVPPGYLDDGKEGDRVYGDFLLWRQTLDFAKARAVPIVLVTSERKEDWWEKQGGRRVAPRPELLREALQYAGQRVVIYQTDHFLEISSDRGAVEADADSVEEIREVSKERFAQRVYAMPAVRVRQQVFEATSERSTGRLVVELLRSVPSFTGSGHFEPNMDSPPYIDTSIIDSPLGTTYLRHHASTGTVFDFNVHVAGPKGENLPVGQYIVEYEAVSASFDEEALEDNQG
ncbi:PIN domain-containing protein [Parvibaculum sp.]|uniref:PIN domain-containing protein n=1 Tax=Parvibaculum sp. TaxID=2024848 RepID=UPI001B292B6B|nr:PIN domain-containing protein [Parvibaculum sp.]MBO6636065.1 DUF4935 domain-containing protein [Parvibaculum sp.]MBO6678041.1 DUF4935 domain-containing protein [Parvibaculum sp.]MBO6686699.1 DUF4935 domain-containing protein [Parvibaculum sp.]MBO6904046.1 DUF4935 domain-containing protein [Parvibaculum sp.]